MNVVRSMLSQSMSRPPSASVAQRRRNTDAKYKDEEFVEVVGPKKVDEKEKREKGTLGLEAGKGSGKPSVEISPLHSVLAQLGSDPTSVITALQAEILRTRNGGRIKSENLKRYYTISTTTVPNGTISHLALSGITTGTNSANRADDVVRAKELTIQANFLRTYSGVGTDVSVAYSPTIRYVVWRDKVPAIPGTATATLITDTNPPSSNVAMFSRLGQASVNYNSVAVISSDTIDRYHIYHMGKIAMPHKTAFAESTTESALPYSHYFTLNIPLHELQIQWQSESTGNPMINALYFSFFSDMDYTGVGYSDTLYLTSDLSFFDEQI